MYSCLKQVKLMVAMVALITGIFFNTVISCAIDHEESFSVLLLGIDTGALGRSEQGRSDVMMIMTVNPQENRMSLTSIPRDTYVEVPELEFKDKLNHAYAYGGSELSLKIVNAWLGSNIHYYMQVDFSGIEHLVDVIGGIDVVPPATFEISGFTFIEGERMHLNGEMALAYARERYTSGGDYARQERQREIIQAIINKLNERGTISKIPQLIPTLLTDIKTNFDLMHILNIYQAQKNDNLLLETHQLEGQGTMIDGVYYDLPDEESIDKLKKRVLQSSMVSEQ